jgi:hypothetical protein
MFTNLAYFQGSNNHARPVLRGFFTPHATKDDDQEHQKKVLSPHRLTRYWAI